MKRATWLAGCAVPAGALTARAAEGFLVHGPGRDAAGEEARERVQDLKVRGQGRRHNEKERPWPN